jgi:hypothetical protein
MSNDEGRTIGMTSGEFGMRKVESEWANLDGFVKSPKRANFQISHLIISIGYGIEI